MMEQCTEKDFWEHFGRIEHEALEFKREMPTKKPELEAVPAMAMTDGGTILIGIDDKTLEIVGYTMSQQDFDRLTNTTLDQFNLDVKLRAIRVGSTEIVAIEVPAVRDRLITTSDGRLLRRVGGTNKPLVGDAMASFIKRRPETPGEEKRINLDTSQIEIDLLNEALRVSGRPPVAKTTKQQILKALTALELTIQANSKSKPEMLLAAGILFGKQDATGIQKASVQLVRRTGREQSTGSAQQTEAGPAIAREEISGPLTSVLSRAVEFINAHTESFEMVRGLKREQHYEYPQEVLREAVLNALAHRDYNLTGASIDITIWDDFLKIQSPGTLPGYITPENMREEHYRRNPRIMRVLKALRLVEDYGEGIDRMYSEMGAAGLPPPEFIASDTSVTVVLRNESVFSAEERGWVASFDTGELSPTEAQALVFLRRQGAMPRRKFKEIFSEEDADRLITELLEKGLLRRNGERGGSYFRLSDEVIRTTGSQGREPEQIPEIVVTEIKSRGSMTTAEVAEFLDKPIHAARRILNDLLESGRIRAEGNTRARRYSP